jgi:hypothetical protein
MHEDDLETLLETAAKEIKARRRKLLMLSTLGSIYIVLVGSVALLAVILHHSSTLFSFIGCVASIPAMLISAFALSNRFSQTARKLAECDDVRAIPALLWAAMFGTVPLRMTVQNSLIRLLYTVTEKDKSIFTADVLTTQRRLFNRSRDLKLALLHAYAYVGGSDELSLANGLLRRAYGKDEEMHAAAERCATAIRTRISQANQQDMLLRVPTTGDALNLLHTTEEQLGDNAPTIHGGTRQMDNSSTFDRARQEPPTEQERLSR